ncbi:MAG: acetyl-CoA carboxylase biotin carboxyl carrier protein [Armatimonadetes bacterium]|nr:acetyl-CoA carboxylase biotin carboxyl carrier protein [Armatimonadota bacterium]
MSDRIDFDQVREVIRIAAESDLIELEVESPTLKVRVKKAGPNPATGTQATSGAPAATAAVAPDADDQDHLETVAAPMVGTFYRASSPEVPPFVKEGDIVGEGQVICVIEAMKLFNEIQAEKSGRIARVLVDNASPVEYGQPLFLLDTTART